ncbi:MAG TPA: CHAP domain-containing protein, partial [Pilimelia sp.]|nr:CHAP domain-containing protein [Pilimelia sp.]
MSVRGLSRAAALVAAAFAATTPAAPAPAAPAVPGAAAAPAAASETRATLRQRIVKTAMDERGTPENSKCDRYFRGLGAYKCKTTPWCGAFTYWVWKEHDVRIPTTNPLWATNWGKSESTAKFKLRGSGKGGNPQAGDVIVYGKPGTSGHVGIVVKVRDNGNLDTVEGNSSNKVTHKENL